MMRLLPILLFMLACASPAQSQVNLWSADAPTERAVSNFDQTFVLTYTPATDSDTLDLSECGGMAWISSDSNVTVRQCTNKNGTGCTTFAGIPSAPYADHMINFSRDYILIQSGSAATFSAECRDVLGQTQSEPLLGWLATDGTTAQVTTLYSWEITVDTPVLTLIGTAPALSLVARVTTGDMLELQPDGKTIRASDSGACMVFVSQRVSEDQPQAAAVTGLFEGGTPLPLPARATESDMALLEDSATLQAIDFEEGDTFTLHSWRSNANQDTQIEVLADGTGGLAVCIED